jgi:Domain of unknown function (DUF4349)
MRRLGIVLTLLALTLTGCTAGSGASDSAGSADSAGINAEEAAPIGPPAGGESAEDGEAAAVADVDEARQVVVEGSVTLTVERPRIAARDAAAIVEGAGGHVQERVEQAGDDTSEDTAWLVVRVPSDGLTQVLAELERLGRVDEVELTSTDVTAQAQDLDARIRALEISVGRLQDLLSRAQTTSDVVAAEQTLTERQSDLEALVSQRNRLADRVEMSTVRLMFQSEEGAPAPARAGFGGGLSAGWESLGTALSAALLVLGVLLPWALVAAGVLALVLLVRREVRRRQHTVPTAETAEPSTP